MTPLQPANIKASIAASTLFDQDPHRPPQLASGCQLLKLALQDGIDLVVWKGNFDRPVEFDIYDDINRISFSCTLSGCSQSRFEGTANGSSLLLREGMASIGFNPGRRGTFTQDESFESVTVMVRPDVLATWAKEVETVPKSSIEAGRYLAVCTCNAELRATAQILSRTLCTMHACPDGGKQSLMWLLGQSVVMISLILEMQSDPISCSCSIPWQDRQRLLHARDRLLQDLSRAPTLLELSCDSGLSMLKLKRGFRQLFNNSVYGLFQQERMHEARQRLSLEMPVLTVAADLGYTNASHFAAAFKKQFGVNPSAIKCHR